MLSLIQILWDRGEPNGYAWHMTDDPLPNTPAPQGAPAPVLRRPPGGEPGHRGRGAHDRLAHPPARRWIPGGHADRDPYFGIPRIARFPYEGDASLVVWDIGPLRPAGCGDAPAPECLGTPTPPITNTPPRIGVDPHDLVIESEPAIRRQISEFLRIDGRAGQRLRGFPLPRSRVDGPLTVPH